MPKAHKAHRLYRKSTCFLLSKNVLSTQDAASIDVAPMCVLFFIAIGYIPESPHSLIVKNRKETAREVLALFYEDSFVDQMVEDQESAIFNKKSEMQENKVTWSSRGVTIGFVLSIMQVLSGIASFVTQAGHVISFTFN